MATQTETKMKALHYDGPFKVSVQEIDLPKIEHPDDCIIRVTTSCICGSDLHMYQGRTAAQSGLVFGHENMGVITEVGSGVTLLKKGDRIVLPFNVADGRCRNCEEGKTAFCTGVNPGFAGGAYGYVAMGPYQGGQAQYLRVPYADFNALTLPEGTEHEADFALLADIVGALKIIFNTAGVPWCADVPFCSSQPAGTDWSSQALNPVKVSPSLAPDPWGSWQLIPASFAARRKSSSWTK